MKGKCRPSIKIENKINVFRAFIFDNGMNLLQLHLTTTIVNL